MDEMTSGQFKIGHNSSGVCAEETLSHRVAEIRASGNPGRTVIEEVNQAVVEHDRRKCIGAIAFEDLWNGVSGWISPEDSWDMVRYIWRNAPEFFEEYDTDREIDSNPSRWTQQYLDVQRNFLRHNFCLERLCHLVMVYEYLHGDDARKSTPPLPDTEVLHNDSGTNVRSAHLKPQADSKESKERVSPINWLVWGLILGIAIGMGLLVTIRQPESGREILERELIKVRQEIDVIRHENDSIRQRMDAIQKKLKGLKSDPSFWEKMLGENKEASPKEAVQVPLKSKVDKAAITNSLAKPEDRMPIAHGKGSREDNKR